MNDDGIDPDDYVEEWEPAVEKPWEPPPAEVDEPTYDCPDCCDRAWVPGPDRTYRYHGKTVIVTTSVPCLRCRRGHSIRDGWWQDELERRSGGHTGPSKRESYRAKTLSKAREESER